LFDSSPLLATSEAQVLSRFTGQVAMVVRAGDTPRQAVKTAIGLLNGTAAVTLVLNQYRNLLGAPYYDEYYGYEPG
jgi:protein-tyrosine kinase